MRSLLMFFFLCGVFLIRFVGCARPDDTYMYDDAARGAALAGRPAHHHHHHHHQGHWYDEPPYESDPDDFLMSGMHLGPAAKIQVSFFVVGCCRMACVFLLLVGSLYCCWVRYNAQRLAPLDLTCSKTFTILCKCIFQCLGRLGIFDLRP